MLFILKFCYVQFLCIYVLIIEVILDLTIGFLTYSVAHFLESRGIIEDALEVATDPDYRFDLAMQLGKLEIAKVRVVCLNL